MFDFDKKKILLYGYSQSVADTMWSKLIEEGYEVLGFLDQNAGYLRTIKPMPVWRLDEISFSDEQRREIVVVILLQNGRIHDRIAEELYRNLFEYIIYVPIDTKTPAKKLMFEFYNLFLERDFSCLKGIPNYNEMEERTLEISSPPISAKYITKKIPVEFIYSDKDDNIAEQPIVDFEIYRELYDYLSGKRSECQNYLKFCGIGWESEEKYLADRKALYERYEQERQGKTDYFKLAAPHAKWNENGYFNIVDGHHRAVYLTYHLERELYLRISKVDAYNWEISRKKKECI